MTRGHIFGSEPRVQIRLIKDQVHSKIFSSFFNSKQTAQMKLDKVIEKDNSLGEQMNGGKKRVSIDFGLFFGLNVVCWYCLCRNYRYFVMLSIHFNYYILFTGILLPSSYK